MNLRPLVLVLRAEASCACLRNKDLTCGNAAYAPAALIAGMPGFAVLRPNKRGISAAPAKPAAGVLHQPTSSHDATRLRGRAPLSGGALPILRRTKSFDGYATPFPNALDAETASCAHGRVVASAGSLRVSRVCSMCARLLPAAVLDPSDECRHQTCWGIPVIAPGLDHPGRVCLEMMVAHHDGAIEMTARSRTPSGRSTGAIERHPRVQRLARQSPVTTS